MNLLYSFWANEIPLRIYFTEPKIGIKNPLYDLEKTIANWTILHTTKHTEDRTLMPRIQRNRTLAEQCNIVISMYPSAKTLFEQSYNELVKRRYWRI